MSLPSRATAVALPGALAEVRSHAHVGAPTPVRALALVNTPLAHALALALTTVSAAALAAPPAANLAPAEGPLQTAYPAPLHHTPLSPTAALTPATADWRAANATVAATANAPAAGNAAHPHHPVSPNSRSAGDENPPIPHSHPAKGQP